MHYTSNQIFQKIGMITKSKLPETSILIDKIHIYQKLQYIMGLKKYKKFHVLKKKFKYSNRIHIINNHL